MPPSPALWQMYNPPLLSAIASMEKLHLTELDMEFNHMVADEEAEFAREMDKFEQEKVYDTVMLTMMAALQAAPTLRVLPLIVHGRSVPLGVSMTAAGKVWQHHYSRQHRVQHH